MRTSLTLDDDVAETLRDLAHRRRIRFREVVTLEHQCELHSGDADFARFPGLRWRNPLA